MLKRLIEVALPLKEVSEQSAREKSIRHGHISTLHIWWARRPLAACRAVVFASLIPDPDDPECPEEFRTQVKQILSRNEFKPKNGNGSTVEDTPRNRCLEFIKYLVRWENSNKPEYIEPARKLIAAAHRILHPDSDSDAPKVLDPFAGGGAIPLEALRLGCEAHAIDLNPVAHLIELCTLVYPQKYGQPNSRPVPQYIRRLLAHNRAIRKAKGETDLFEDNYPKEAVDDGEPNPDVEITEEAYRQNPLAADVRYWGAFVFDRAKTRLRDFYPTDHDGKEPIAYIWARTIKCPNPSCGGEIPLYRQSWLGKKRDRRFAFETSPGADGKCSFKVVEGPQITFDPDKGTIYQGKAECPFCGVVADKEYTKSQSRAEKMGQQLLAVALKHPNSGGEVFFRSGQPHDLETHQLAVRYLEQLLANHPDLLPDEPISPQQPRVMFVTLYGITKWCHIFDKRQLATLLTLCQEIHSVADQLSDALGDVEYATAVASYLGLVLNRVADYCSSLSRWDNSQERNVGTFGRQCLPMVWDYGELVPFSHTVGCWNLMHPAVVRVIESNTAMSSDHAIVRQGSATRLPAHNESLQTIVTDPPYYDAIPYAELSDFFYVWLKRSIGSFHGSLFQALVTPKTDEIIEQRKHSSLKTRKDSIFYEKKMGEAFREAHRVLSRTGVASIMFAHKSTAAWETMIRALLESGLQVSASWPLHTEAKNRLRALNSAALASSVTLVCRKRTEDAGDGLWDDVRQELKEVAKERLDFFWDQGIRGADFFISAIGPALSVYGRYARVIRLSGEEVTVGEFLDEVRSLVTNYALTNILHTTNTANIDPESRFYIVWKWSYGDAKVPADESFKLAQALGIDTEEMWDKTGVLTKSGENVQCLPVEKRMKVKDLGEPSADGAPASLIDVLHRMCAFRDKNDSQGMAQFLGNSGHANNPTLWLVAQAVSESLPDGDKEKQLMQGLLNQREGLEEATRQRELF